MTICFLHTALKSFSTSYKVSTSYTDKTGKKYLITLTYHPESITFSMTMYFKLGFPGGSVVKNSPANAGDAGGASSMRGSGRSPGGRNGNPL